MDLPAGDRPKFPFAKTRAATSLRLALDLAHRERGLSIRQIGAQLGYKQATVLSHMASGRVPVPLERATEIARAVGLDPAKFLTECVEQRNFEAAALLSPASNGPEAFSLVTELDLIAGHSLDDMTDGQKLVMREVASDPRAARRWLSAAELPFIELVRRLRPDITKEGLSSTDMRKVAQSLSNTNAC